MLWSSDSVDYAGKPFTLTPPVMVGVQLFLCWLLYLYTAMALRENVLKVCQCLRLKRDEQHLCAWDKRGRSTVVGASGSVVLTISTTSPV